MKLTGGRHQDVPRRRLLGVDPAGRLRAVLPPLRRGPHPGPRQRAGASLYAANCRLEGRLDRVKKRPAGDGGPFSCMMASRNGSRKRGGRCRRAGRRNFVAGGGLRRDSLPPPARLSDADAWAMVDKWRNCLKNVPSGRGRRGVRVLEEVDAARRAVGVFRLDPTAAGRAPLRVRLLKGPTQRLGRLRPGGILAGDRTPKTAATSAGPRTPAGTSPGPTGTPPARPCPAWRHQP